MTVVVVVGECDCGSRDHLGHFEDVLLNRGMKKKKKCKACTVLCSAEESKHTLCIQ